MIEKAVENIQGEPVMMDLQMIAPLFEVADNAKMVFELFQVLGKFRRRILRFSKVLFEIQKQGSHGGVGAVSLLVAQGIQDGAHELPDGFEQAGNVH